MSKIRMCRNCIISNLSTQISFSAPLLFFDSPFISFSHTITFIPVFPHKNKKNLHYKLNLKAEKKCTQNIIQLEGKAGKSQQDFLFALANNFIHTPRASHPSFLFVSNIFNHFNTAETFVNMSGKKPGKKKRSQTEELFFFCKEVKWKRKKQVKTFHKIKARHSLWR